MDAAEALGKGAAAGKPPLPHVKRQRPPPSMVVGGCYLCWARPPNKAAAASAGDGNNGDDGHNDDAAAAACAPIRCDVSFLTKKNPCSGWLCIRWWLEGLHHLRKRRKVASTWSAASASASASASAAASDHHENYAFYRPPPLWKQLTRKLRAKARHMSWCKPSLSFHYDPLSYSLNFDDGCWQNCESHVRLASPHIIFPASMHHDPSHHQRPGLVPSMKDSSKT